MTTVVLDTNTLQADWRLTGMKFTLVRHAPFYPPMSFVVPAIVVEELVANHAREVERHRVSMDVARRKLAALNVPVEAEKVGELDYRAYVLARFDEVLGIDVLPWPDVPHQEIALRAVHRTPPFDEKGSGYRDSLVWADVRALMAQGRDVAFVTADKDFAVNGVLAPNLAAEIADLDGTLELVPDFGSWLITKLPWRDELDLPKAVDRSRDEEFGQFVQQSDFSSNVEPDAASLGFLAPTRVEILEVSPSYWVERVSSRESGDGLVLVEYDIGETVTFEAELRDGEPLDASWTVEASPITGRLEVSGEMEMVLRVGVLFDHDGWSVDELSWRRDEALDPNRPAQITGQVELF